MKYGLSAEQLTEIKAILSSYDAIEQAILFGSRAIDTYKEASDVDIAIKGEKADWSLAMTLKDHFEEETYLPFFFDVVAYSSIKSDELREHIDRKGKVLCWVGRSEWRKVKLGDHIKTNKNSISKGYPYSNILYLDTGSITVNRIDKLQEYNVSDAPSRAKRLVEDGDVIYSSVRPNQLHYGFIKNPKDNLVVSTGFVVINCDKENIQSKFLLYYLSSNNLTEYLHSIAEASTSAYPSLKPSDIEALEVSLPPLPEQKAIAQVLGSLDDKIALLHRQNKTLEQMAETLFRQWFVEEAGEDWEEGVLGDIAINVRDSVKTSNIKGDMKYVGLEHIDRRSITLSQYGFGDEVSSNKSAFDVYDILFGKLRPYFHKVCFSSFAGICSTDILVVRPKLTEYFAYCLFAFFQNDVVEYANLGSGGTRMPRTSWSTLKKYPISIPTKNVIFQFNEVVEPSIKKVIQNSKQIHTLKSLRYTLLPKLMSGEVRVKI